MNEFHIERTVCRRAVKAGWLVRKLTFPGRNGAPDRLFAKRGALVLIEFKRPGGKTSPAQEREIERLRAAGLEVHVVDDIEVGLEILGIYD